MNEFQELYTGMKLPQLGFGVWQIPKDITAHCVKLALKAGYRYIDTATAYDNEKEVGEGIRQAMEEYGIKREEIFVSTKLWNDHRGHDRAVEAIETSLKNLGLDYIDLYMLHWPAVAKWHDDWRDINANTYRAVEEYYRKGKIKSIGVANYLAHHLEALIEDTKIKPMVNQIEYHPGFGQIESANYCHKHDIIVEAWSPLGCGEVLQNKTLKQVADKYNKTTAQICIRWLLQKNIIPIIKSTHEERMIQNMQVFDFEIHSKDMQVIDDIPYCGGMRFNPDEAKS